MAGTANINWTVSANESTSNFTFNKSANIASTIDPAGSEIQRVTADTTAAGIAIAFSTVTAGWGYIKNLSSAIEVLFGGTSGGSFVKVGAIPAATSIPFFFDGTTVYVQTASSTAAVQAEALDVTAV